MTIAERVARRWKLGGFGSGGQINGTYFTLTWTRTKWRIEELADGSPIPKMTTWGEEGPPKVAYEMPNISALSSKFEHFVGTFNPTTILAMNPAPMRGNPPGAQARENILAAHEQLIEEIRKSLREDIERGERSPADLQYFERVLPEIKKRLVWKKARA